MYIKATYRLQRESADAAIYRRELKNKTPLNLRRSSKYNLLAVLGAMECISPRQVAGRNLGIYIATDYACSKDVAEILQKTDRQKNLPIMPFDFLNVNSNNVSFYVAKALDAAGKNMVISSSEDVSFEKALQTAAFDFAINRVDSLLIGAVDTAMEELQADTALRNTEFKAYDISCWIYIDSDSRNALGRLRDLGEFSGVDALAAYLQGTNHTNIKFNQAASEDRALAAMLQRELGVPAEQKAVKSACELVHSARRQQSAFFIAKAQNGSFHCFALQCAQEPESKSSAL
ncbi:MAG: hypothetical protein ACQERK_03130 [Campylobacterota bacterium]